MTTKKIKFSVIIPAYNSKDFISNCLQAILDQSLVEAFEVIVVVSADDGACIIIRNNFPEIKLIQFADRIFPGAARNAGLNVAKGELVAFIDAHNIVPGNWLSSFDSAMKNPLIDGVGGSRSIITGALAVEKIHYWIEFLDFLPVRPRREVTFFPAGNSCFRRSKLANLAFEEDLRAFEDVLFCRKLVAKGCKLEFRPDISVEYIPKKSWSSVSSHIASLGFWAGYGRRKYKVPGIKISLPTPLIPVLGLYRTVKFFSLTLRFLPKEWLTILAFSPKVAAIYLRWAVAFSKGSQLSGIPGAGNRAYSHLLGCKK